MAGKMAFFTERLEGRITALRSFYNQQTREIWTDQMLTIQNWHLAFRRNDESFPNKNTSRLNVSNLSMPLDTYPEVKDSMVTFMKQRELESALC
jgi:hypothetical protein